MTTKLLTYAAAGTPEAQEIMHLNWEFTPPENRLWWISLTAQEQMELTDRILDEAHDWDFRCSIISCRERMRKGLPLTDEEIEKIRTNHARD